jgi:Holliday junction DNA helicase RuvB
LALDDMIGQETLINQLRMICAGSQLRESPMPHCLLVGPAGHGKTTIASIISNELGATLIATTGMTLQRNNDLVSILMQCSGPTVLFIDEIHALRKSVMEVLYEALEDNKVSTVVGTSDDNVAYSHQLQDFVCIGATTRPGLLTVPFRQRFGFHGTVEPYTYDELATIVARAWDRTDTEYDEDEPMELAMRCKGVPRRALHLADRVLDFCAVQGTNKVEDGMVSQALFLFGIDERGLDQDDHRILNALCNTFGGRTVGIDTLAQFLNMDVKTVTEQHEPYLCQSALMTRTKTGRMALPGAYDLVG